MESSDGIVTFWILVERKTIADDEGTAWRRLTLRPDEEVISVNIKPMVVNRTDPPEAVIESMPEMLSAMAPTFGGIPPRKIRMVETGILTWPKRMKNWVGHMVNPTHSMEEVYPSNGHGWDLSEDEISDGNSTLGYIDKATGKFTRSTPPISQGAPQFPKGDLMVLHGSPPIRHLQGCRGGPGDCDCPRELGGKRR